MIIKSYVSSVCGEYRECNEDSFVFGKRISDGSDCSRKQIFFNRAQFGVFDGIGGLSNGHIASSLAAEAFMECFFSNFQKNGEFSSSFLKESALFAENKLNKYQWKTNIKCGTTAAVLCVDGENVSIFNCGDSKIFMYSNQELSQVSYDHNQKNLFKEINISVEKGLGKLLTQYMGMSYDDLMISPYAKDIDISKLGKTDFIICSDGAADVLSEDDFKTALQERGSNIAEKIVRLAVSKGSHDNITVIVIQII